jgi:hypothetical protein
MAIIESSLGDAEKNREFFDSTQTVSLTAAFSPKSSHTGHRAR